MEQNNEIIFSVICNDQEYLNQTIEWYNSNYNTNFEIVNYIYDEVNFAEIKVSKFKLSDLFDLGYQFGVKEQSLRQQGKIDW